MLSEFETAPVSPVDAQIRPVRRIMVCDDDLAVRYSLKRLLTQELSATVTEADNGLVALKALRADPPDLLVLDLHMPVIDGVETLQAIRSTPELAHLPVIVLTGDLNAETVRRVIDLGVTDYLGKPLSRPATKERLQRIIAELRVQSSTEGRVRPESRETPALMAGQKLLVADPSEDFRYFMRTTFGSRFKIAEAANGVDALDAAMELRPHAVIIGRGLGQLGSDQLAQKLRLLRPKNDLVLLAVASRSELEAAQKTGLYDTCITRSFVPEVFEREFDALGPASLPMAELLELCPTLRGQIVSAAEQVFGMMLRMEVEPHDRVVVPFHPPYAHSRIPLTVGDHLLAHIDLIADQASAEAFAMAMFGIPEATEALAELSNIVAGRVKHALVAEQLTAVLGLPDVHLVQTGDPDARPHDALGVRFGVTNAPHELEVRLIATTQRAANQAAGVTTPEGQS